jgi:hypothetical protein
MALKAMQFVALMLTALALVPAGAHLFELPNKIGLSQDRYFIVQQIYRGWALFGFVLLPATASNLVLAIMLGKRRAFDYDCGHSTSPRKSSRKVAQVPACSRPTWLRWSVG